MLTAKGYGSTPLHVAGSAEVVVALIAAGADVNAVNVRAHGLFVPLQYE